MNRGHKTGTDQADAHDIHFSTLKQRKRVVNALAGAHSIRPIQRQERITPSYRCNLRAARGLPP